MPKKQKRAMTCKLCGVTGYNSRKCPTKRAVWTLLTSEEVEEMINKLGISKAQISEEQVLVAIDRRPDDFNEKPLAHTYHKHQDRFENALLSSAEPTELSSAEQTETDSEVSPQEIVEDVRWKFQQDLYFIAKADYEGEELLIGNSIFDPTIREDKTLNLGVGVDINKEYYNFYYEYTSIDELCGASLASAFYADVCAKMAESDEDQGGFEKVDVEIQLVKTTPCSEEPIGDEIIEEPVPLPFKYPPSMSYREYGFNSIPDDAIFVGYESFQRGFKVVFYQEENGFLQGFKDMGFCLKSELEWDDALQIIKKYPGAVELQQVAVSQMELLDNMRADSIPVDMWRNIDMSDVDMSSEEFTTQWLVPANQDVDPIFMGAKVDPSGKRWRIQAVCID